MLETTMMTFKLTWLW